MIINASCKMRATVILRVILSYQIQLASFILLTVENYVISSLKEEWRKFALTRA